MISGIWSCECGIWRVAWCSDSFLGVQFPVLLFVIWMFSLLTIRDVGVSVSDFHRLFLIGLGWWLVVWFFAGFNLLYRERGPYFPFFFGLCVCVCLSSAGMDCGTTARICSCKRSWSLSCLLGSLTGCDMDMEFSFHLSLVLVLFFPSIMVQCRSLWIFPHSLCPGLLECSIYCSIY